MMATNAAKYGAFKIDGGTVTVKWRQVDGRLLLDWTERGGPAVAAPPDETGFGTKLLQTTLVGQFEGTISYDWNPTGLSIGMSLPTANLSR
jgi:two-component sensor histidine kinase